MDNQQIRKLSAIMFTDIVGYSKMMGADERGTLEFLGIHNQMVKEEVADKHGKIIKTIGDAFLVDFDSAVNAVRAAVAIQNRMTEYNRDRKDTEKRYLRIGIHLGDVVISENDIFGDGVNIASRIQPIAEPGGICISHDVYNQIKNKIDVRVINLGPQELKNIAEKMDIYAIVLGEMEGRAAGPGRRRTPRRVALFAGLAVLAAMTAAVLVKGGLHPFSSGSSEDQDWQLWYSDDFDDQSKFEQNWRDIRLDQYIKDGYLNSAVPLNLKATLPIQPVRIRMRCRPESDARDRGVSTQIAFDIEYGPGPWFFFRGLFYWIWIGNDHVFNKMGYSGIARKTEHEFKAPFKADAKPYEIDFTFDNDLMAMTTLNGVRRETLIRDITTQDTEMTFVVVGQGVLIDRLEIYVRKSSENMDLVQAADKYRLDGKYSLAINLYDDLIRMSKNDLARCRYLYKKALACASLGDTPAEMAAYQTIIDDYPDNVYTGYARFDLGVKYYQLKKGREAVDVLRELANKQPDHPEASKAHVYVVSGMFHVLGDTPGAERYARQVIERMNPTDPKWSELVDFLVTQIMLTDTNPETVNRALAFVDERAEKGGFQSEYLSLESLRMTIYVRANQIGRFFDDAEAILRKPDKPYLHSRIVYAVMNYEQKFGFDDRASKLVRLMKENKIASDEALYLYAIKAVRDGDTPSAVEYFKQYRQKVQMGTWAESAKAFLDTYSAPAPQGSYVRWTVGESTAVVTYEIGPKSVIQSKDRMILHLGVNGWQQVRDYKMERKDNRWSYGVPLDNSLQTLNFVFYDGKGKWDNNSGLNWDVTLKR